MFAQNGTFRKKNALNKGMCIYNFAFIKVQKCLHLKFYT